MSKRLLVVVLIGALLDLGVAGAQAFQFRAIQRNAQKNDCWSHVLDIAITHPSQAHRAALASEARKCARLP